jgi:hypothetical protein
MNAGDASSARFQVSMTGHVPVLRPRLPDAGQLLPYLRRIDASRVYTNWGALAKEFGSGSPLTFGPLRCLSCPPVREPRR